MFELAEVAEWPEHLEHETLECFMHVDYDEVRH